MAYIVPSPQIFQILATSGGVLNSTPDLDTCIVGPSYNLLRYISGSVASQVKTAALSTTTTTGDIDSADTSLKNVAAPGGFTIGDTIIVVGAGDSGSNLRATITDIAGNTFTLDTAAGTTVTAALVSRAGKIINATISNSFSIPGQQPGQIVTVSSVTPWLNNARVQTALTGFWGYASNSTITDNVPVGVTGSINNASNTLTITTAAMATQWAVGDVVQVVGAGPAAGILTATITAISGTAFTVTPAASTTATTQAVTKVLVINQNSTTNTLRAEAGDQVVLSYIPVSKASATTFTSTVQSVVTSTGQNGTLTNFSINDSLTPDFSRPSTTGTVGASSTALTVTDASGFATGDTIEIIGAGAAGAIHETTITVSGLTFTLGVAAVTAVTGAQVSKIIRTTGGVASGTTVLPLITGGSAIFSVGDRLVVLGAGANNSDLIATVTVVAAPNVTIGIPTVTTTSVATKVRKINNFQVSVRKLYNNQQLPSIKPIAGGSNFDTSTVATNGQLTINANPEVVYGQVTSSDVYIAYKALRADLAGTINEFNSINDVEGLLGDVTDDNPLALALQVALANTTGRIFGIGVASDDLTGHQQAMLLLENHRMYSLVPLTQDTTILSAYKAHVDQLSTPENASWRVVLLNTVIPTTQNIGTYTATNVNANGGNNTITLNSGNFVLTASNATFISDGTVPGDTVHVTAATPGAVIGSYTVQTVVSNQQVTINATGSATAVSYYVTRTLTKDQQALSVAAASTQFNDNRVVHIQPDKAGIEVEGVVKFLPGYYLAAAIGGMTAGFPVQQGFTNIGLAGISDLQNSNYHFSKENLNTMAAAGTFLIVQAVQGGIPFVRHELTTDVSVLEHREFLKVKNWDFLSYHYFDKISPFIGSWNITPETLNNIRQTIVAASELLLSQKLPKIGAPLLSYNIASLKQNAVNKDQIDVNLNIEIVSPNNYTNVFLII